MMSHNGNIKKQSKFVNTDFIEIISGEEGRLLIKLVPKWFLGDDVWV